MIINIHPQNPEGRKINKIVNLLQSGGIVIVPTDSVYALICDMENKKAVDQICKLRHLDPTKANLTFLCDNISRIAQYTAPIHNEHFRLMKRNSPGPFTFLLKSNQTVPKLFKNKKRTIGSRIPNHVFLLELIKAFDAPLMSTSLRQPEEDFHESDIDLINDNWGNRVAAIVHSGAVPNHETAIIDLTSSEMKIIRDGYQELIL